MKHNCSVPSDRDLVLLANGGDNAAFSALAERYMPVLQGRAGRYASIVGSDLEDFIQEGMLALFRAVKRYDMQSQVQFNTYAVTCIHNAMANAIKAHFRSAPKNTNLSLDGMDEKRLQREIPPQSEENSIENLFLNKEASNVLARQIQTLLSDFERHVLTLYLRGNTYQQIAQVLGTTTKAVDNALQRIRRKLRPVFQANTTSR